MHDLHRMGREACRGSAAAMVSRIWLVGGELRLCSASVQARKGERPKNEIRQGSTEAQKMILIFLSFVFVFFSFSNAVGLFGTHRTFATEKASYFFDLRPWIFGTSFLRCLTSARSVRCFSRRRRRLC